MENPKLTLKQLHAIELEAESILRDRTEIVALDKRRNGNREALRALTKEKGKKTWITLGPMLVKLPVSTANSLLNKDQVTINSEVNKIRSNLKVKVNKLRDLEFESPLKGFDLTAMSKEEISAINQVLVYPVKSYEVDCNKLKMGQFICPHPDVIDTYIDPKTQQPKGCTQQNKAEVLCKAAEGLVCLKSNNSTFTKEIPCRWTNGYHFETAMLLSIFLGMFGADRFYLGYPAIGLLKLCTMGFMFLGQLVDIILIATQVVGPADGSYYIIPYYGAKIEMVRSDNWTYRVPQENW